jgi:hypothetical protein
MFYSPNVVVAVAKESHDSFCYVQVHATLRGALGARPLGGYSLALITFFITFSIYRRW